jgi:hypothetical protein
MNRRLLAIPEWPAIERVNQYGDFDFEYKRVAFIDGEYDVRRSHGSIMGRILTDGSSHGFMRRRIPPPLQVEALENRRCHDLS